MKLNDNQQFMLKSIVHSPKRRQHFSGGDMLALAPHVAEAYLAAMEEAGLIFLRSGYWHSTDAGKAMAQDLVLLADETRAQLRTYCNAAMRVPLKLTPWNVRPGAEDHKRHKTLGMGA